MITEEDRNKIKRLILYDKNKKQIDSQTHYLNFDFPIESYQVSGRVITITLPSGGFFFLPVYGWKEQDDERKRIERQKLAKIKKQIEKEKAEKQKQEIAFLESNKDRFRNIAKEVASNKASIDSEARLNAAVWWKLMKEFYPKNYEAANEFYKKQGSDSLILKEFLRIAPQGTVNDYFRALGLPTIKVRNDEIMINEQPAGTYDCYRIYYGNRTISYHWEPND